MTEKQRLKHIEQKREKSLVGPSATLIGTDRDILDFREPRTPPRLSWLNARTHSGFANRKCQPGRKEEHIDALPENASRIFAGEINKALGETKDDTGPNLQDHQREVPDVAAGTPQA